jgi:hypothetical protein
MSGPPKPKRACIFYRPDCDSKLTKEDVWPTWMKRYVPRNQTSYSSGFTQVFPTHKTETRKKVGGDPRSRRVKFVCQKCNNGWMSRFQEQTKPILLPLITGQKIVLSQKAQQIIAGWCAMSVMTADFFYPQRQVIPQSERDWLRAHGTPPPDTWKIWITRYQRDKWPNYFARNLLPVTGFPLASGEEYVPEFAADGTPRPNTQTTTFVVGELYVHAFSSVCPDLITKFGIGAPLSERICQIWPVREHFIAWPIEPISDRIADNLAGAIADAIDRVGTPAS